MIVGVLINFSINFLFKRKYGQQNAKVSWAILCDWDWFGIFALTFASNTKFMQIIYDNLFFEIGLQVICAHRDWH